MTFDQDSLIRQAIKRLDRVLNADVNMVFQGLEPTLRDQQTKQELQSIIVSLQEVERGL